MADTTLRRQRAVLIRTVEDESRSMEDRLNASQQLIDLLSIVTGSSGKRTKKKVPEDPGTQLDRGLAAASKLGR